MNPFNVPLCYPLYYWIFAGIISIYQGIRGIFIQTHNVALENEVRQRWTLTELIIIHCIHDFIFNFVCSLAGYSALYAICKIFNIVGDFSKMEIGTGIFLSFLSLVALTGIAGVLPPLLYLGKLFGKSS
jgi:hypothetical protein